MRRLLLARHGPSVRNAARRFPVIQDAPLSHLERRQPAAQAVVARRRRRVAAYKSPVYLGPVHQ